MESLPNNTNALSINVPIPAQLARFDLGDYIMFAHGDGTPQIRAVQVVMWLP
jgi:hypothetical protein